MGDRRCLRHARRCSTARLAIGRGTDDPPLLAAALDNLPGGSAAKVETVREMPDEALEKAGERVVPEDRGGRQEP